MCIRDSSEIDGHFGAVANSEAVNAQTRRVQLAILVVEPLAVGPKRNARTLVQFRLRSLLWVTTLAALMFAVSQTWMHSFPVGYVVVALLSIPISIVGFAMLVISGFLAFSIWITPAEDFHRREFEQLLSHVRRWGRDHSAIFIHSHVISD